MTRKVSSMAEPLLVSIHIPKTAGSTLLDVLAARFGERLQRAYQPPRPGLQRTNSDGWPDISTPACIHGHAVVDRFPWVLEAPDARFITFLRDPLAGAISLWRYQQRVTPWDPSQPRQSVAGEVEVFLLDQYNHNRYCQWITRCRRSIEQFYFVGLVERFDESMQVLFRLTGWPAISYGHSNRTDGVVPAVEPSVEDEFKRLNAEDYVLWHRAGELLEEHLKRATAAADG